MDFTESQSRVTMPGFDQGLKTGITIFIGYIPSALAFGLLAKTSGLSFFQTLGMSMFVFAGASQFMALGMIGIGTGIVEIIFSTFIVNIRHLLMSMAIHEKMVPVSLLKRALCAFGITDEVFAVASTREGAVGASYLYGLSLMAYLSWVVNSGVGYVVGAALPSAIQGGMKIALYAMFIGLLVPSAKKQHRALLLALMAGGLNFGFSFFLAAGWSIIAATVGSVLILEMIRPLLKEEKEK